jgi:hypothetical protein
MTVQQQTLADLGVHFRVEEPQVRHLPHHSVPSSDMSITPPAAAAASSTRTVTVPMAASTPPVLSPDERRLSKMWLSEIPASEQARLKAHDRLPATEVMDVSS